MMKDETRIRHYVELEMWRAMARMCQERINELMDKHPELKEEDENGMTPEMKRVARETPWL